MGFWVAVEDKTSLGINKPPNEPGRGDSINSRPWPRNPCAILIFHFGHPSFPNPQFSRRRVFRLVEKFFSFCLQGTFKEVDLANLFQPPLKACQLRRETLRGRFELLYLANERFVIGFTFPTKSLFKHIGGEIINCLDQEHRGLSLKSPDCSRQPFEPFLIDGRIRQYIARVAQCERSIFLELPPYSNPLAGSFRGQAEDQQQPWHALFVLCNTHNTKMLQHLRT